MGSEQSQVYYKSVNKKGSFCVDLNETRNLENQMNFQENKLKIEKEFEETLQTLILSTEQKNWLKLQSFDMKIELLNLHKKQQIKKVKESPQKKKNFESDFIDNNFLKFFLEKFENYEKMSKSELIFFIQKFRDFIKEKANPSELKEFIKKSKGFKKILIILSKNFLISDFKEVIIDIFFFLSKDKNKDVLFEFINENEKEFFIIFQCIEFDHLQFKVLEIFKNYIFFSKKSLQIVIEYMKTFAEINDLEDKAFFFVKSLEFSNDIEQILHILQFIDSFFKSVHYFFDQIHQEFSIKENDFVEKNGLILINEVFIIF